MGQIGRKRKDWAVYWAPDAADRYGKPGFAEPAEIRVRWEETQIEFVNKEGRTEISNAQVLVDQDLELGGILMKGRLTDITSPLQPFENGDAYEIRGWEDVGSIRNTSRSRVAIV